MFLTGNPWWTIYEQSKNHQNSTVTAVRVTGKEKEGIRDDWQPQNEDDKNNGSQLHNFDTSFWKICSPLGFIVGISICLPTLLIVLTLEIAALFAFYSPSAIFFHAARAIPPPPNCCTGIFYAIFLLLYSIFSFLDSLFLLVSVFVTELLAIIASILGFIYGGVMWSQYLHQHIRRSCHGVRIVFRRKKKNPSRQLFPHDGLF